MPGIRLSSIPLLSSHSKSSENRNYLYRCRKDRGRAWPKFDFLSRFTTFEGAANLKLTSKLDSEGPTSSGPLSFNWKNKILPQTQNTLFFEESRWWVLSNFEYEDPSKGCTHRARTGSFSARSDWSVLPTSQVPEARFLQIIALVVRTAILSHSRPSNDICCSRYREKSRELKTQ